VQGVGTGNDHAYRFLDDYRHICKVVDIFMTGERILIVEDEPAVARGLQYGLDKEGFAVLWAENGQTALDLTRSQDPHLILLDIRLPDISGFDVCRQLRAEGKRQPILMLTARDEAIDKVLGLELGADDYVVKPYDLRELIARIRALLRRAYGELAEAAQGERVRFGEVEVDLELLRVTRGSEAVFLTPTEFRLLRYLISNPNRPISRETLIEAVWGYTSDVGSDRTVDVHIRHLREKLEPNPAEPRWIVTVRGMGYMFEG
jgi:two-component system response regulator VicR